MPLTKFTVTGTFTALVRRSSQETNPDPFPQPVSATIEFTPSHIEQIPSQQDQTTYILATIGARIDNGEIKNLRGDPVRLVANTSAIGPLESLQYRVTFRNVVYGGADRKLDPFSFQAPTEDTTIDLATVPRITTRRQAHV